MQKTVDSDKTIEKELRNIKNETRKGTAITFGTASLGICATITGIATTMTIEETRNIFYGIAMVFFLLGALGPLWLLRKRP